MIGLEDEEYLKEKLRSSPVVRHLFAKLGGEISVQTNKDIKIIGILKAIDISLKILEVEARLPNARTYFVNFKHIIYVEADLFAKTP